MAISTQRNIVKAVVDALESDVSFNAAMTGIYAGMSPDDAALPFCRVEVLSHTPNYAFGGGRDDDMTMVVHICTDREDSVANLQAHMEDALAAINEQSLTVTGWNDVQFFMADFGFPQIEGNALGGTITGNLLITE